MAATVMAGWLSMLQLLAIIGIFVVAFGLMVGMLKPSDAWKHMGLIQGMVLSLILLPRILLCAWLRLLMWQKFGLVVLGAAVWLFRQSKRRGQNSRLQ